MHLVSNLCGDTKPFNFIKTILISSAIVSTLAVTGCASKPQVTSQTRFASAPNYYTVRSGDTLSIIAARYGLSYLSIAEMNDIAPPYRIYVGQSLRLKASGSAKTTTQPIKQSAKIERQKINIPTTQPPAVIATVPAVNPTTSTAPTTIVKGSSLKWVKPSNGPVLERFNLASNVKGVRYGGNVGDPVFAAADGQVVYAADGLKEYGNLILIKHADGYITAYAHNNKLLVKSGQNVNAGQTIAEMGASGATRTMLEFQVRLDGKPINPENILLIN